MNLSSLKEVYFIGIGGIGMSALARYFKYYGASVSGYDKTRTPLTKALEEEGIRVFYEENISHTLNADLIIYTPAIPADHKELSYCFTSNKTTMKRAEVLGEISKNVDTIAVGGTHGKTTVTCMIAHLFKQANYPVNAFIGGISSNYQSNLILSENASIQVMEADEFDRSFLKLKPAYTVLTSTDQDHLDIYETEEYITESFNQFSNKATKLAWVANHAAITNKGKIEYGIDDNSLPCYASNFNVVEGNYLFDLHIEGVQIDSVRLGMPGKHNVENAVVASAVFLKLGGAINDLKLGLQSFKGIKRRFEVFNFNEVVYIDDYAHHPTEINALIGSVRELYPSRKILGIFQPHLFSRTQDFAEDFAKELANLDELILLEIYPARELPIKGVDSQWLLDKVDLNDKQVLSKEETLNYLEKNKLDVILTIGAGDVDQLVEPIKEALYER